MLIDDYKIGEYIMPTNCPECNGDTKMDKNGNYYCPICEETFVASLEIVDPSTLKNE